MKNGSEHQWTSKYLIVFGIVLTENWYALEKYNTAKEKLNTFYQKNYDHSSSNLIAHPKDNGSWYTVLLSIIS